jgi:predicted DCC family thiol-disulfide oxidoreductase YuxK
MTQLITQFTTYYDGGCPLCSKEIAHYQRMDRDQQVRWIDLTQAADELAAVGLDTETAMRRLHVRDADGRTLSGVPAFVAIWQRLPRYRVLAQIVDKLGLIRPLDWFYARFADWRFRRRCVDGACAVTTRRSD